MKTGEIWLANLNPSTSEGTEAAKTRPVLILQSQILLNVQHPSTLIIPLTTNLIDDANPLRIRLQKQDRLERDSDLLIDQIRAIDNKRLIDGPLAQLTPKQLRVIHVAVLEVMGVDFSR
ncbi:type II toxin-antitoxin system PemK/MazF family toxin [Caedibacter taeniospiralis]|uniref:type II toxin-antitoxin system PemK/MazF family toxin n=1 Tax=Caedibacter taeniospiralis TaxID=28907 RepID=UPI000C2720AA|nr:type II toxin-antitoxin system PemK/MazF family toxin [Caedibacter taeniospiralis]